IEAGTATLASTELIANQATGGQGGAGGNGGDGGSGDGGDGGAALGGGLFVRAGGILEADSGLVSLNVAQGGVAGAGQLPGLVGQGLGGGVLLSQAGSDRKAAFLITGNRASTAGDDVYGPLAVLP